MGVSEDYMRYLNALRGPFVKLCRLRFMNPDGSTAFALDNNASGARSGAFVQDGSISVNLQNGQRRQASVTLSNVDGAYDYSVNKLWFGQEIALDEGLLLPDGREFYLPQGVFVVSTPTEEFRPGQRTVNLTLLDKWAMLDGTLFGNLDGTYQADVNTDIFDGIRSVLDIDRGNGVKVDRVKAVFTEFYNGKTQTLQNGSVVALTKSPYTLTVDSEDGSYADVILGFAAMVNAWVGYDPSGALRIDPSQDDILDTTKPVLWTFSPEEAQLLGATYTVKNTEVFNDIIIMGEALDSEPQAAGRATNLDPASDTNIYTSLGRRTKRESAAGYYTDKQCEDLAVWKLKRMSVLQKSVDISCGQMFHIRENDLVLLTRPDKPGAPQERHLIMGFQRPLAQTGEMTISAVSVNDFATATATGWPE